jgi:hypothetical protein
MVPFPHINEIGNLIMGAIFQKQLVFVLKIKINFGSIFINSNWKWWLTTNYPNVLFTFISKHCFSKISIPYMHKI